MASRGLLDDDEFRRKKQEYKTTLEKLQAEQADTSYRVKNWYEIATKTFETLLYAGEKFKDGDLGNKKDVLQAIGQNPKLLNGKILITPNEWLIPVAQHAKRIRAELDKVRTEPLQIQKASEEAIRLNWCRV